ncbi:hypothetical protein NT6N_25880 [Oceaniferula spumae]|uniref:DUF5666 domain-containing protein n=1 Tax=Oceaniferula spumae TaxID=2979115 RepID=A0AAT9FNL0_9BACT
MKRSLLILWLLSLLPCFGELPPSVYADLKKKSPEKIEIRVDQVKHQSIFRKQEMVTATVTKVMETSSKLKVGDKIEIRYRHVPLRGAAGPSPIPKLKAGASYPAWLKQGEGGIYVPAARGKSFTRK